MIQISFVRMGVEVVAFNISVEHRRLANAMLAEQFGNEGLFGGFHQTFFPVTAIVEITGKQKKQAQPFQSKCHAYFHSYGKRIRPSVCIQQSKFPLPTLNRLSLSQLVYRLYVRWRPTKHLLPYGSTHLLPYNQNIQTT